MCGTQPKGKTAAGGTASSPSHQATQEERHVSFMVQKKVRDVAGRVDWIGRVKAWNGTAAYPLLPHNTGHPCV